MVGLDRRQVLLLSGMAVAASAAPGWARAARAETDPTRLAIDFTGDAPRGSLAPALQGAPRLDLEEGTGARIGVRIEGAGRNHAWSTGMQGAEPGLVGAGGALPRGWRLRAPEGVAVEVAEITGEEITLRARGTPELDGPISIAFGPEDGAPATAGQDWTGSFECRIDPEAAGVRSHEIWIEDSNGDRAAQAFSPQTDILWPTEIRHEVARPGALSHGLAVQVATGAPVRVSIRLRRPQLEPGPRRSGFIVSANGDGRRQPDRLTVARADGLPRGEAWAATVAFRPGTRPSGVIREWVMADGRRLTLFLRNYAVRLETASGEDVSRALNLGRVCRFGPSCVAVSFTGGVVSAQLNGGPPESMAANVSGAVTDRLGWGERGPLGGWLSEVSLYDRALDPAELRRLSMAGGATLSDAFDRGDGVLTGDRAPTGQVYGGVELGEQAAVAELEIASRAVVARDSGAAVTAAYCGVTFDASPRAMRLIGRVDDGEAPTPGR